LKEFITLSPAFREERHALRRHRPSGRTRHSHKALQQYCRLAQIQPGTPDFHDAGRLIMVLFESRISDPDELARALQASDRRVQH
jgi:hypothetical protein